ncbi:hypothetical protein [Massilia endophytica]|uniref:hypothetical protein n=1 Tax=Massilia endophytica TaxID=2899220 RepID=UPI001E52CEFC|nr:hypothetical protein [Massilia endophytica]UGQ46464.1 hypothetical protein LSQ66_22300 [Massilia endophytica]
MQEMPRLPQPRASLATGLGVSLLLHGLLFSLFKAPGPEAISDQRRWSEVLTVVLTPPAPPSPPKTEAVPEERQPEPAQRTPRPAARRAAPQAITMAPAPAEPADLPAAETADGPRLDMEAAKASARQLAAELDPPGKETVYRETKEERLGRAISAAKRGNCKDFNGAGLLSPLIMLLDKKDSGCKW